MKCRICGQEDRIVFGWVEETKGIFYEVLCCHLCNNHWRGNDLPPDDPAVMGFVAEREERQLVLKPLLVSGATVEFSKQLALMNGKGETLALIHKDRLWELIQWAQQFQGPRCTNTLGEGDLEEAVKSNYDRWLGTLLN